MTKSIFLFIVLFVINSLSHAQDCNCKYVIPPSQVNVDATSLNIQPGDTVCIQASTKKILRLVNFHGTPSNNIVFINYGGQVIIESNDQNYGLKLAKSSYVQITGTGSKDFKYGIKIRCSKAGGSSGISLDEGTTNYEVDHLDIANSGFAGIWAKTDPRCDLTTNRGNFTQYQTIIHDNYVHNTGGEGMYVGHSFYTGYTQTCDNVPTVLMPNELKGVRIYNNIVDSTHWDGIQVGCAVEDCEIYGNTVTNAGLDFTYAQNNGIQMGGGTTGKCYNNYIANSSGNGIILMGLGNSDIYNNVIVNAGYNYFPSDSTKRVHGIFCDDRTTIPGASFNFYNNTIINPKTDGIRFSSIISKNNKFYNNIILQPGSLLSYSKYSKENCYINVGSRKGVEATISYNYFDKDLLNIQFVDAQNNNFRLLSTSPAIDAGTNLSSVGIYTDFDSQPRPSGLNFDIGAFEYQDTSAIIPASSSFMLQPETLNTETNKAVTETDSNVEEIEPVTNFTVFPNPNNGQFSIARNYIYKVNINIFDSMGNLVYQKNNFTDNYRTFDIRKKAKKGRYYITLSDDETPTTKTIIIE